MNTFIFYIGTANCGGVVSEGKVECVVYSSFPYDRRLGGSKREEKHGPGSQGCTRDHSKRHRRKS